MLPTVRSGRDSAASAAASASASAADGAAHRFAVVENVIVQRSVGGHAAAEDPDSEFDGGEVRRWDVAPCCVCAFEGADESESDYADDAFTR